MDKRKAITLIKNLVCLIKNFNEKNSIEIVGKNIHNFGQYNFNMSIVIKWWFWLVILNKGALDHLNGQITIFYFRFYFQKYIYSGR
jgi:hypothetical protein